MNDNEANSGQFQTKINAAVIVNQAVLRCQALGMRATADNVIICVGDFFDPTDPVQQSLIREVMAAVNYTLGLDVQNAAE